MITCWERLQFIIDHLRKQVVLDEQFQKLELFDLLILIESLDDRQILDQLIILRRHPKIGNDKSYGRGRRKGPQLIGTILVAVLARPGVGGLESELEPRIYQVGEKRPLRPNTVRLNINHDSL